MKYLKPISEAVKDNRISNDDFLKMSQWFDKIIPPDWEIQENNVRIHDTPYRWFDKSIKFNTLSSPKANFKMYINTEGGYYVFKIAWTDNTDNPSLRKDYPLEEFRYYKVVNWRDLLPKLKEFVKGAQKIKLKDSDKEDFYSQFDKEEIKYIFEDVNELDNLEDIHLEKWTSATDFGWYFNLKYKVQTGFDGGFGERLSFRERKIIKYSHIYPSELYEKLSLVQKRLEAQNLSLIIIGQMEIFEQRCLEIEGLIIPNKNFQFI